MKPELSTLLLVTHVAIRQGPHGLLVDDQTAAGIVQWCKHFDQVTYYGVAADEDDQRSGSSVTWVDIRSLPGAERCEIRSFPRGYRPGEMIKNYRAVREEIREQIARHRHLCFTIGGLVGDWPAMAASESSRLARNYAAWIDRVEPAVVRNKLKGTSRRRQLAGALLAPAMELYTRKLLRSSSVALLQGRDTFDHYRQYAADPHCTYDTHTTVQDQIPPDLLSQKLERILNDSVLRIVYVGRAAEMKGPYDWIEALSRLQSSGMPFQATWHGDGPQLAEMRARVAAIQPTPPIELPGFQASRAGLLNALRESDLLLFCHKTPESPRTLIEALVSGCPMVGYESAYPNGLIEAHGGGVLVPQDDVDALVHTVTALHEDRPALAKLVTNAAESGSLYNEDAVYAHRAGLMRQT